MNFFIPAHFESELSVQHRLPSVD